MGTLHADTGLLRQRHELATMEIQGADESVLIRPGPGTAQGSEGAADAFHRVYHKRIDKWSDHLRADLLHLGSGPHIVKSDGEQCRPGQRAG